MAISYRSTSGTGDSQSISTIAPAVPAGATTDDIVIVYLERWFGNTSDSAVTAPSGFTQAGSTVASGDNFAKISVWWKRLTATDSGTYSFSWTGATWTTAQAICLTGAVTSGDPIGSQFTSAAGTYGTFATLSLTLATAGDALVWGVYNDTAGAHTPPTSFTEIQEADCGSLAYYLPNTAGSVSAANGSVASSSPAAAVLLAVATASGGGGGSVATPGPIVTPRAAAVRASSW